jgi:threonine dehydratase
MEIAEKENWLYVHPFNDPFVISGQGTIIREIKEQIGTIDHFICSIGGGGLISGCLKGIEEASMICQVYGVETIGANAFYQSRKQNKLISLDTISSKAESLGAKSTNIEIFNYVNKNVRDLFEISDSDAIESLQNSIKNLHLSMELAASCNLSVLDKKLINTRRHDNIVVLICGANIDYEMLKKWILEK